MFRKYVKRGTPQPAMVVALVALVMSMTGGAYALGHRPDARPAASHPAKTTSTTLASGKSESGVFVGAGGSSTGGWFGMAINYRIPLAKAISANHIIDTQLVHNKPDCPGPGHAAKGYLCLYPAESYEISDIYGYSTNGPYGKVHPSVGVSLYAPIDDPGSYADGVWTVTAP